MLWLLSTYNIGDLYISRTRKKALLKRLGEKISKNIRERKDKNKGEIVIFKI
jgi:hypothetical protein